MHIVCSVWCHFASLSCIGENDCIIPFGNKERGGGDGRGREEGRGGKGRGGGEGREGQGRRGGEGRAGEEGMERQGRRRRKGQGGGEGRAGEEDMILQILDCIGEIKS